MGNEIGMGDTPPPPPPPGDVPPPPPPPSVVGYGKRSEPLPASAPRAPASILHAQRGAQPLPQMRTHGVPPPGMAPGAYIPVGRYPFERNLVLTIAQLLAVAQGILGLINGVTQLPDAIKFSNAIGQLGTALGRPDLATRTVVDVVAVIVISLLVIAGAAVATRPSNIARWLLVAWELVVVVSAILMLTQFSLILNFPDIALVALAAGGVGFLHPLIILTMAAIIIFGFTLYPPTWDAYRR